jgi:predicted nucleotidyltransferase
MRRNDVNQLAIQSLLCARLPGLQAIYAFGSQIDGTAGPDSDLDLAVLVDGYAPPILLWELSGEIADLAGCPVDLLDFRAASTVMQYRILTTGQRWWSADSRAELYEAGVLSDKTELDWARAGLLADIQREGRIYGR